MRVKKKDLSITFYISLGRRRCLLIWLLLMLTPSLALADLFSTNVNASTITILDSYAEVLYPQAGQTFWVQNQTDQFNLTASGKGHIKYEVVTDDNPLTLYEKSWMYLDSYFFHVSDPITFAANTTTLTNWNIPYMSVTGLVGVAQHTATSKLSLTYLNSSVIETALDTHNFEVKVVPAPDALILGSIGLSFSGWLLRRCRML